MTTASKSRRSLFHFILSRGLAAVAIALFLAPHLAQSAELRGRVTETKGSFCKIELPPGETVAKGTRGKLLDASGEAAADVQITAVLADYVVGKTSGAEPSVGAIVVLPVGGSDVPPPPVPSVGGGSSQSDSQADAKTEDKLDEAVGMALVAELKTGNRIRVKLLRVVRDDETGQVKSLRLEDLEKNRAVTVGAASVAKVLRNGQPIYEAPAAPDDGRPKSRSQVLAEQQAEKEAEEHRRWLERLEVRGVKPWPVLTEEQHDAALAEHEEMIKKVQEMFPDMAVYRTEQFQFVSNMPPQQAQPYVVSLDAMYDMMCKMYRIKKGERVWRGKALVFAFLHQQQFVQFERAFMQHNPDSDTYGLCHSRGDGDVIISCYRGNRAEDFGHMLVHETSHGFIHRYKTALRLPSWVNEGMAEYIGQALVPASRSVKIKERIAFERMKQIRSMGGNFLTSQAGLESWQYGVASSLNDFLIRADKNKYVHFIEGMKEGLTWQESLEQAYKTTPEQMVSAYGAAIGIPDLRP